MARSSAATPQEYLSELRDDRRAVVETVRDVILENLPDGYEESVSWGMLSYEIPLDRYPDTYNGRPLSYVGLAAQKNHFSLYLTCAYADPVQRTLLEDRFAEAGKRLDMGKSCIRFKKLDDLPLDAIGEIIASTPPTRYIQVYEASRRT